VLKEISDMGIGQSILSASKEDVLTEKIGYYGIGKYFCRILGLDNHYAESKVDRGKKWIAELNLNPQDVLLIGDTTHDYIVSKHIGSDCLLIASGHYSYERLVKSGVDVVSSLKEIIQV
jgi:phosphoglycolate phosphatase